MENQPNHGAKKRRERLSNADPQRHSPDQLSRRQLAHQLYPLIDQLCDAQRISVEEADKLIYGVNISWNFDIMKQIHDNIVASVQNPAFDFHAYIETIPVPEETFAQFDDDLFSKSKEKSSKPNQRPPNVPKKPSSRPSYTPTATKIIGIEEVVESDIYDKDDKDSSAHPDDNIAQSEDENVPKSSHRSKVHTRKNIVVEDENAHANPQPKLRKRDFAINEAEEDNSFDSEDVLTSEEKKILDEATALRKNPKYAGKAKQLCNECGFRTQTDGYKDGLCSSDRRSKNEKALRKILSEARRAEREKEKQELDTIKRAQLIEKKRDAWKRTQALRDLKAKQD